MADIQQAMQQITADIRTIVRGEIELAKAEVIPGVKKAGLGAGLLAGAAVFALIAVNVLFVCLGFAFTNLFWGHFGPIASFAFGFLCAVLVYLLIAAVLAFVGLSNVKKMRKPEAAISEAQQSVKAVQNGAATGLANVQMIATRGKKVIKTDEGGQIVTVYAGPKQLPAAGAQGGSDAGAGLGGSHSVELDDPRP